MMGSFDQYPPNIRALLEKVAEAGYREVLLDKEAGDRFIFDAMATSTDTTVREIGEQLRDGAIDLGQLARSDYYHAALNTGADNLTQLDVVQMVDDIDEA